MSVIENNLTRQREDDELRAVRRIRAKRAAALYRAKAIEARADHNYPAAHFYEAQANGLAL